MIGPEQDGDVRQPLSQCPDWVENPDQGVSSESDGDSSDSVIGPEQDGDVRQPVPQWVENPEQGFDASSECEGYDGYTVCPDWVENAEHNVQEPDQSESVESSAVYDETVKFLHEIGLDHPTPAQVKMALPLFEILEQIKNASTDTKKLLFSQRLGGSKKRYAQKSTIARAIRLSRNSIFPKNKSKKQLTSRRRMADYKRRAVDEFLRREDNSYTLPDKKYYRKDLGIPIVALVDCMRNLHRKFVVETDLALSFATFCKARDKRTVKTSVFLKRSVCLCKPHANMGMMLEAVDGLPNRTSELILLSEKEITDALDAITADVVHFKRWDKETRWYPPDGPKKRKVYHTVLKKEEYSKKKFRKRFLSALKVFRAHQARVEAQYAAIKLLKAKLPPKHVVCQMDYAENWATSFMAEIQAAFFGKDQLTLHPMVMYAKLRGDEDPEHLTNVNFVGVSSVKQHSFPTTFTFLFLLVAQIKRLIPDMEHLHLVTDSPSSQYRNRYACQMLKRASHLFGIRITWNWLEAGHGKGPCDGVGGALKGLADRTVKSCGSIQTVDEFISVVQPQTVKINLLKATSDEIKSNSKVVESWKSREVRGITTVHQATVHEGKLYLRETSCYEDCCLTDDLRPTCSAWFEEGKRPPTNVKRKRKARKGKKNQRKKKTTAAAKNHDTSDDTTETDISDSDVLPHSSSDSDAQHPQSDAETEVVTVPLENVVIGCNEIAAGEAGFSSDEDDELDRLHTSHRTAIRRHNRVERRTRAATMKAKHRLAIHLTTAENDAEYSSSSENDSTSDNDSDFEPIQEMGEKYSRSDIIKDKKVSEERRKGRFQNEMTEHAGYTSGEDWALSDTVALTRYLQIQEAKCQSSEQEWSLAETLSLQRYKDLGLHLTPKSKSKSSSSRR